MAVSGVPQLVGNVGDESRRTRSSFSQFGVVCAARSPRRRFFRGAGLLRTVTCKKMPGEAWPVTISGFRTRGLPFHYISNRFSISSGGQLQTRRTAGRCGHVRLRISRSLRLKISRRLVSITTATPSTILARIRRKDGALRFSVRIVANQAEPLSGQ